MLFQSYFQNNFIIIYARVPRIIMDMAWLNRLEKHIVFCDSRTIRDNTFINDWRQHVWASTIFFFFIGLTYIYNVIVALCRTDNCQQSLNNFAIPAAILAKSIRRIIREIISLLAAIFIYMQDIS